MAKENKYKVLICDDDEDVIACNEHLLRINDFDVLTCTGGREAVEIMKNTKVDILVLDYFMPEFSGEDVVDEIRKFNNEIFIIINTGYTGEIPALETMQRLNIQGYHDKSDSSDKLLFQVSIGVSVCKQIAEIKRLFKLSTTDGLTNLYNRSYLFQLAEKEFLATKRYKHNLSVMMIDIDHFKNFNDTHGHKTGDEVLRRVSNALAESVRQNIDIVGRYGGEEFAVVLPETDLEHAKILGERLRENIEKIRLIDKYPELRVTVSVGIASLNEDEDLEELFRHADELLYKAKKNGRNRVEV
ncbi:MAG: hypothetical protein C0412_14995 [Flavobacterium sp.]|nr:hypothetical protein [Flavobacterium sp.]